MIRQQPIKYSVYINWSHLIFPLSTCTVLDHFKPRYSNSNCIGMLSHRPRSPSHRITFMPSFIFATADVFEFTPVTLASHAIAEWSNSFPSLMQNPWSPRFWGKNYIKLPLKPFTTVEIRLLFHAEASDVVSLTWGSWHLAHYGVCSNPDQNWYTKVFTAHQLRCECQSHPTLLRPARPLSDSEHVSRMECCANHAINNDLL